jgi:diphosphomevalonate decarboxylase
MGSHPDGSDSLAVQIAPESHWEDMHVLICIITGAKKVTSSTAGMQRTVETSPLLPYRATQVVPQRMRDITKAIHAKDFDTFAQITMADSNQFHAVALDTDPPIIYLNDASRAIITIITEYNRIGLAEKGSRKAAYTFDAGPNAVIFTPASNVKEIIELITYYFPQKATFVDPFGLFSESHQPTPKLVSGFNKDVSSIFELGAMQALIHTKIGDGPRILGEKESLLDADGLPKIEDAVRALDLSRTGVKEQLEGSQANAGTAAVAGQPN